MCCTFAVQVVRGQLLPLWQVAEHRWPQSGRGSVQGCWQPPSGRHSARWQSRLQRCISQGSSLLHVRPQEMSCRWHGILLRCWELKETSVTWFFPLITRTSHAIMTAGHYLMLTHAPFLNEVGAGWTFVLAVAVVKHYIRRKQHLKLLWKAVKLAVIVISYLDGHTRVFLCTCFCTRVALCHRG